MHSQFNPDKDIPALTDKIILITGGTAGLGAGSVIELAKHEPAHIIFTGRNQSKANAVIDKVNKLAPQVKITFISCDISSFDSVRSGATAVQQATDRLDTFMLNAGIMATPPALSVDGYEMQFATNHLGHALLVKLLLPLMQHTASQGADVRVINMTSIAYEQAPSKGIVFDQLKTTQPSLGGLGSSMAKWRRYGQSKLAQMLYTEQLAQHYPDITFVSVHPGFIMTDLFGNVDFITKLPVLIMSIGKKTPVEEGHYNQCWAATCSKSELRNGEYYVPIGDVGKRTTSYSKDKKLAEKLWSWTESQISS